MVSDEMKIQIVQKNRNSITYQNVLLYKSCVLVKVLWGHNKIVLRKKH